MKKPIIVLGAGGHAKVLISSLLLDNFEVVGILDNDENKIGQQVLGISVIGNDEAIEKYSCDSIELVNGVGSVKSTALRKKIFELFKNKGYTFTSVIHPSAIVAFGVKLGEGVQIMAGAVVQAGVCLGNNVIINTKASVDHDCFIENNVHIAPGATLSGEVYVGDGTHLGTGAIVKQGVRIGKNCVIGAGALALKDIPDNETAIGNPARGR
jgi:UDP-perosamine 4-acetyltransferase